MVEQKAHKIDKVCMCEYCTMIDIIIGDPEINNWEKEFINSVCEQGWQRDYTDKQKDKIEQIFDKQRQVYSNMI